METVEIITAAGVVLAGVWGLVRYQISENKKREQAILEHTENAQRMLYEYIETKNGHMERMANRFTESSDKQATAINNLATEIKILSIREEK